MSIKSDSSTEKTLKNNEEALVLREIFNIIEAKKENKEDKKKNSPLLDKYHIKSLKIEKLSGIDEHPKNRYKSKLQKILLKKKL